MRIFLRVRVCSASWPGFGSQIYWVCGDTREAKKKFNQSKKKRWKTNKERVAKRSGLKYLCFCKGEGYV